MNINDFLSHPLNECPDKTENECMQLAGRNVWHACASPKNPPILLGLLKLQVLLMLNQRR
jgi:hypothetical protein